MKTLLTAVHGWLGVVVCLLVFVWFTSGIGMMYLPFPEVTVQDALNRAPDLDPHRIHLSFADAAKKAGVTLGDTDAVLASFDGRPVFRFGTGARALLIEAETGDPPPPVTRLIMDRAASRWVEQPIGDARIAIVNDVDQWTVLPSLRRQLPLTKYSWATGDEVYVSTASGAVVQHTTRQQRLGAYLGPIPHWLYFTPLRKRSVVWSRVVVLTSGFVSVSALIGLIIAIWVYSPSKRYRPHGTPTAIPYRGQKRWHVALGLVFGVATVTWAASGLLSMEPFPLVSSAPPHPAGPDVEKALAGSIDMSALAAKSLAQAMSELGDRHVRQLALSSFAGEPFYLASLAGGATTIVSLGGGPKSAFEPERVIDVLGRVRSPGRVIDARILETYDRYYLDRRHQLPLPAIVAVMDDVDRTRVYIDPKTARVVGSYNDRNWAARWLYNGLHSLNFPWLYNHRPLWDIVVIVFMLGGATLAMTAIILAWQLARRNIDAVLQRRA